LFHRWFLKVSFYSTFKLEIDHEVDTFNPGALVQADTIVDIKQGTTVVASVLLFIVLVVTAGVGALLGRLCSRHEQAVEKCAVLGEESKAVRVDWKTRE